MRLQMYKGQEYSAVISRDISDHEDFTYRAYQKALTALDDIAKRANRLAAEKRDDLRWDMLYRYSQNMIVFSGARGQGKTSAMLSFSETLRDRTRLAAAAKKESLRHVEPCGFLVMDPIDPTVLEHGQSLLALVLSRMLAYSEQQWACKNTDYCGRHHDRTAEHNEMLRLFQDCLNGINVVKSDAGSGVIKGLADVHKISDSSLLKRNFYHLANKLLDHAFSNDISVGNRFLVLQFDDTDFQIARGYEVMEDIRKYLTVPNIVILMATDTELLRKVLTQHYASEFDASLTREFITPSVLSGISAKYLAKLVPPTYTAYMPHLNEEIRDQREQITLHYIDGSRENLDLVCPEPGADEETLSKYSFQDIVLRYIYKKTHLIFASHSAYMNNIIPTTLRGLAQLLSLLEFMEDVPELSAEDMGTPETLVSRLKEQLPVIRSNLELFEAYFMNDWVQAKLNVTQIDVIQKLSNQAAGQRIQYAASALRTYYNYKITNDGAPDRCTDYSDLEKLIDGLRNDYCQPDDYYFFFAVNTLLTIENNKTVLKIKQDTCARWKPGEPVVFYYLKAESSLPRHFYLPNTEYAPILCKNHTLVKQTDIFPPYSSLSALIREEHSSYWFCNNTFSFLGLLTSALNPVSTYEEGQAVKVETKSLYQLQDLACVVAANTDVREQIRKCFTGTTISLPKGTPEPDVSGNAPLSAESYVDALDDTYRSVIFPVIAAVNTPNGGRAMSECFSGYRDIGITSILRSWIPNIQKALVYISSRPNGDPSQDTDETEELTPVSVLSAYYQLAIEYISSTNRSESNFLTSAQQIFKGMPSEKRASLTGLSAYLVKELQKGSKPQNVKSAHNRKLSVICKNNGVNYHEIKKAHGS